MLSNPLKRSCPTPGLAVGRAVAIAAVIVAVNGAHAVAQTITAIGPLVPLGPPVVPAGLNSDGTVVVGWAQNGVDLRAVRWTSTGGPQDLGAPPGAVHAYANGVSGDGLTVVGDEHGGPNGGGAFLWTSAGGMQELGSSLGFVTSNVTAVSEDGVTVAGSGQDSNGEFHSFLWTSAGGMQLLDSLALFGGESTVNVNQDGSAIVGNMFGGVFLWTSTAGMQNLGLLPGRNGAVAADVNSDGTVAVGNSYSWSGSTGFTFIDAFGWTASGGMQDLGVLPGDGFSYSTGVNGDGSIVVGNSYSLVAGYVGRAFLWTPVLGMVELNAHLAALGLDLTGWDLGEVKGISVDGSALFGFGTLNGQPTGWVVNGLCEASWSNYGIGFPGTLGIPSLTAQGDPVLGTTLNVYVGNSATTATIAAILVGTQPTSVPMGKGGDLLVVPLITFLIPLPVGGTTLAEDIDNDAALCGLEFFVQSLVADRGAAKRQSASAGLKLVLGY